MTSLQSGLKQIPLNAGYYINIGDCRGSFYANYGTDELPRISTNVFAVSSATVSTLVGSPGRGIFRDMGKTLTSAARVFRKVQLMTSTNSVLLGGTDGVGGVDTAPFNYLTGYIELPGQGTGSGAPPFNGTTGITPVARLG
jgi:hypothetical protein